MLLGTVRLPDGIVAVAQQTGQQRVRLSSLGHESVRALIEAGPEAWQRVSDDLAHGRGAALEETPIATLPPLPDPPRNIFCVGLNYKSHFDESRRPPEVPVPANPVFFTKPFTTLVGHDGSIEVDSSITTKVDWEAEVAVVLGLGGKNIPEERAAEHVFGYALANDVSARDLQLDEAAARQWFKGKSLDTFCPMGPMITTAGDAVLTGSLSVDLRVDGELKQSFSTGDMIHSVARIVSSLSRGMRLLPGDIILTGTSAGVGHHRRPPEFLVPGTSVEIVSPQLGRLANRVVKASQ